MTTTFISSDRRLMKPRDPVLTVTTWTAILSAPFWTWLVLADEYEREIGPFLLGSYDRMKATAGPVKGFLSTLLFGGIMAASLRRARNGPCLVLGMVAMAASLAGFASTMAPVILGGGSPQQPLLPGLSFYEVSYLAASTAFGSGWMLLVLAASGASATRWVRRGTVVVIFFATTIPFFFFAADRSPIFGFKNVFLCFVAGIALSAVAVIGTLVAWIGGHGPGKAPGGVQKDGGVRETSREPGARPCE